MAESDEEIWDVDCGGTCCDSGTSERASCCTGSQQQVQQPRHGMREGRLWNQGETTGGRGEGLESLLDREHSETCWSDLQCCAWECKNGTQLTMWTILIIIFSTSSLTVSNKRGFCYIVGRRMNICSIRVCAFGRGKKYIKSLVYTLSGEILVNSLNRDVGLTLLNLLLKIWGN